MAFNPKDLNLYPTDPGVYLMKNEKREVLYVGKAKNLKVRLKQYFSKRSDERETIPYLLPQVEFIDTVIVLTEKDALLLENNLIKQYKPKYNVLLKDDKSFISLCVTKHKWPMIRLVRYKGKPKDDGTYFGPYTNALAARQIFDLISKLFPLRQCSDQELMSRKRPCLLYDIKRCIAPCVNKCTEKEYNEHVLSAVRLLQGKDKDVLLHLQKEMERASDKMDYEKAGEVLKKINQLKHVTKTQHIDNPFAKDSDILGIYREQDAVMISLLLFREGKLIGSEHFSFHFIASSEEEILESFILQHYKNAPYIPSEILVPLPLSQMKNLKEVLSESSQKKVHILFPQKGDKKDLIQMGQKNAKALFVREQDAKGLKEKMLLDLQETLALTRFPKRIECFDTSNISGTDPVASLVCFIDGEKERAKTRLFKIKETETADDYTAMKEVIRRHLKRGKETNDFCDLLIVDGGKGQLNLALQIFNEFQIASIDVIAVSKQDARHDKGLTEEKIFVPHKKDPIHIEKTSPLLFLLQKIRDEAHRQAIEYHRKRRSKRTIQSSLEEIPGIGSVKRKKLLLHFKSIKNMKSAKREDFEKIKGLTQKDIDTLLKFLKNL